MKRTYPRGARFKMADVPSQVERLPVELLAPDGGIARGIMYRQAGTRPKVGALMLHPRMDQSQSYLLLPLVAAGYAALGCAGRYVHNDSAAIQERLLLDVAEGIKVLRAAGCEQVILVGNSGGGAILTLYQAQARTAPERRLHDTPAGDSHDLGSYDLPAADGLVLLAAHPGEGTRLCRWLDPSVIDEDDPMSVDHSLDMYDPHNGFRVPPEPSSYSEEFLTRFAAGQRERAARLDERARDRIGARVAATRAAEAMSERGEHDGRWRELSRRALLPQHLLIARVLACPAWLDTSIEPDDRDVGSFNNDPRPDLQNWEESIATFLLPEAYLSTWSGISSRANINACLPSVPDPLLVVHHAGDATTHVAEARRFVELSAAVDTEFVLVRHADHWGFRILGPHQRGERTTEGTEAMIEWVRSRFPLT